MINKTAYFDQKMYRVMTDLHNSQDFRSEGYELRKAILMNSRYNG